MRVLITGGHGMLGQDLSRCLEGRHDLVRTGREELDVTDEARVGAAIGNCGADVVIHAAAFTAVDECERQPDVAYRINGEGTRNVAAACRQAGVPMLYVSTDYVFDGEKSGPYVEADPTAPLNVYGKSKLQGEKSVRERLEKFWIVRTSWLFGPFGKNFVRTVLDRAHRGDRLRVVDDQVGAPTYTADLSAAIGKLIEGKGGGIYHVTNQGFCSWFEFAREILRQAGLEEGLVEPIPTSASGRPARRPRNSRLANEHLLRDGLPSLAPWQDGLLRYLERGVCADSPAPRIS